MQQTTTKPALKQVELDRERPVYFGWSSLNEAADMRGLSLEDINGAKPLQPGDLAAIIFAGLKHGARKAGEPFDLEYLDVCDLLDEHPDKLEEIFTHYEDAQPAAGDEVTGGGN